MAGLKLFPMLRIIFFSRDDDDEIRCFAKGFLRIMEHGDDDGVVVVVVVVVIIAGLIEEAAEMILSGTKLLMLLLLF